MLGSLAKKLRAFGFDTVYYREGGDAGLLDLAMAEGRLLLTSDRELAAHARSKAVPSILVTGTADPGRLSSMAIKASSSGIPLVPGAPRCSVCNGVLEQVPRRDASSQVPPSVWRMHRLFFRCSSCGQFYWRGSHWKKLRLLRRRLGL